MPQHPLGLLKPAGGSPAGKGIDKREDDTENRRVNIGVLYVMVALFKYRVFRPHSRHQQPLPRPALPRYLLHTLPLAIGSHSSTLTLLTKKHDESLTILPIQETNTKAL